MMINDFTACSSATIQILDLSFFGTLVSKKRTRIFPLIFAALLFVSAWTEGTCPAQSSLGNDVTPPLAGGHSYIHLLSETVTPSNGQVSINIGLPTPKGRGLDFPFSITYNSNGLFQLVPYATQSNNGMVDGSFFYNQATVPSGSYTQAGWTYGLPSLTATSRSYTLGSGGTQITCHYTNDIIFSDSTGGSHFLGITAPDSGNNTDCHAATVNVSGDGIYTGALVSGIKVASNTGTVYTFNNPGLSGGPATTSIQIPSLIEDRNGNEITLITSGTALKVQDTLNRTLLNISNFASASDSIAVSGLSSPYQIHWTSIHANGPPSPTVTPLAAYNTPGACASGSKVTTVQPVTTTAISAIVLPNSDTYTFSYDPVYGTINRVTYPSGAYVQYTWEVIPQYEIVSYGNLTGTPSSCVAKYDTYGIKERDVSYDGSTIALKQTFSYTPNWGSQGWNTKTTTVTDFDEIAGTSSTTTYIYNGYGAPSDQNDNKTGYSSGSEIPVEAAVNVNGISLTTENWFSATQKACSLTTVDGLTAGSFNIYSFQAGSYLPIETMTYDYGIVTPATCTNFNGSSSSSLPPPTKDVKTTFATFPATKIFPPTPSLLAFPQSINVTGSGGNSASTTYSYDQSSLVSVSAIGHDSTYGTSYQSPRANLTSVTRNCSSNCTSVTTTFTYDDTGQRASSTDGCGNGTCAHMIGNSHTTTYSYTDNPSNGNTAGNSNAYITSLGLPATANGATHNESFQYDYPTGNLTIATDENAQSTNYYYSDPLARLTDSYGPASSQNGAMRPHINIKHTDGIDPIIKTTAPTGMVMIVSGDGLGRTVSQELMSDPDGGDFTDTVYDGAGRTNSVTNPYRKGVSNSTDGTSSYQFDALGRKTLQVEADGTSKHWWCYDGIATNGQPNCLPKKSSLPVNGTWVDISDEVGTHQQQSFDGLGRLISVMEPNAGNVPALETDYQYDSLDNLIQIDQWGGAKGAAGERQRHFSYDSLSRLIYSSNAEAGVTCYGTTNGAPASTTNCVASYDLDGNLEYRTDARGITTSYGYDSLSRLLSKTYPSGTSSSCYQYDTSALVTSGGYLTGRLTNSWTQAGPCPAPNAPPPFQSTSILSRKSVLAYDAMGRVVNMQQCTKSNCSTNNFYAPSYTYDLAGKVIIHSSGIASGPGAFVFTNSYNGAGHICSVLNGSAVLFATPQYSSGSGCTTANPTLPGYSPAGGLMNATFGTGLRLSRSYDNRLRIASETDTGNAASNSAPGTATITISGTDQTH